MEPLAYLKRRGHAWYFRLAIPRDLRHDFSEDGRKAEIVEALKTRDLDRAKQLRWERKAAWERRFQELRGQPDQTPPADMYRRTVARFLDRAKAVGMSQALEEADIHRDGTLEEAWDRTGIAPHDLVELPPDLQAQWDATKDVEKAFGGHELPSRPEYSLDLQDVADRYLRELEGNSKAQTVGQYRSTLRLLTSFVGNKPIAQLSRRDVAQFIDEVEHFHPNWGRSSKTIGRSFAELCDLFHQGEDELGISNKTLNRYLTAINGMWKWADRRDYVSGPSPTHGLFRPVSNKTSEPFRPVPDDMLPRLFDQEPPEDRTVWEVALVALFSGMRQNEICSLNWSDIREENGIAFFDITAAKSEAGVRKVPVHPALGWLLDRRQDSGQVWPSLKPGGPDGRRNWYFSKKFTTYRRRVGVDGPGIVFHSLRKNATKCLERARVRADDAAQIIGHEKGFTYRVYNPDGLSMDQKLEIVKRIEYPGVTVPDEYRW